MYLGRNFAVTSDVPARLESRGPSQAGPSKPEPGRAFLAAPEGSRLGFTFSNALDRGPSRGLDKEKMQMRSWKFTISNCTVATFAQNLLTIHCSHQP